MRYRVVQRDIVKFQGSLIQIMEQLLSGINKERVEGLDKHSQRVAAAPCMETVIEEFQEALETACRSFRIRNNTESNIAQMSPGGHQTIQS